MTNQKALHVILQSKGGVGKTLAARLVCDWLLDNQERSSLRFLDADSQTQALIHYKSLGAEAVPFINEDDQYDVQLAESFFEDILNGDKTVVLDIGAGGFVPFVSYAESTTLFGMFRDQGYDIFIHVPITGGGERDETLLGFDSLCQHFGEDAKIVVWINPHFGPIEHDGKPFEKMRVHEENKHLIHGVVNLPRMSRFNAERDFQQMSALHLTFGELNGINPLNAFARRRLKSVYSHVKEQLDLMFDVSQADSDKKDAAKAVAPAKAKTAAAAGS